MLLPSGVLADRSRNKAEMSDQSERKRKNSTAEVQALASN